MPYGSFMCAGFQAFRGIAHRTLLLLTAGAAVAAPVTLTKIDPPARIDLTRTSLPVTLTGTGFNQKDGGQQQPVLVFSPTGMINYTPVVWSMDGTTGTTTFTLTSSAVGMVDVTVHTASFGDSSPIPWDTGVSTNQCLESLQSSGCMLRWEVDASAVTGSTSQTNNTTTPNILFKLDYQVASPKDPKTTRGPQIASLRQGTPQDISEATKLAKQNLADRFATHLIFKTGYTQVPVATKVQPTGTAAPGTAPTTTTSCPGMASASMANCTAATPQQAFVADAAVRIGWNFGRDGQGTFSEIGFAARGSFQDIIPANQVIQSGGLSYVDLSSANLRNSVGLYEGTFHFRLGQAGHDTPAGTNGKYHNVSDLLVIEAGYQNNSGLQQLIPSSPQTSTRNRFVGRFYAYPELPGPTHTKILVGMEYSGGIDGGPKVIQLFWGTNLNPAKLLNPTGTPSN
jgi:hypothetical protein